MEDVGASEDTDRAEVALARPTVEAAGVGTREPCRE